MANFKALVEAYGGTALRWSQDRFIGRSTFGHEGVCAALAAKWIKDRKAGINFAADTNTQDGREEVMQMALNQHKNPTKYVAEYLQLFGLYKHFTQFLHGELSIGELTAIATGGPGYYFIGLTSKGVEKELSGHAFAVDMFKLKFFDPNFGQATFDNEDDLKKCFTAWFRLIYIDLHGAAFIERYI